MKRRRQQGSVLTLILLGILAVSVLATIAYGAYFQIARGTMDTMNRANSSALLTQGVYALATAAAAAGDIDADGVTEPPAGLAVLSDGFEVPSGAPITDAWGSKILYCPWDNGSTNSSLGRLTGANPVNQSSLQLALVSAGPDRTLSTTCAQVWAAGPAALPNGDDGLRTMTVAQLNQGVGGTYFYGDPVADISKLPASAASGTLRVVKDTQIPYLWNGSSWLPLSAVAGLVAVIGDDCSPFPPGLLARNLADDLLMCKANGTPRVWKKMSP